LHETYCGKVYYYGKGRFMSMRCVWIGENRIPVPTGERCNYDTQNGREVGGLFVQFSLMPVVVLLL